MRSIVGRENVRISPYEMFTKSMISLKQSLAPCQRSDDMATFVAFFEHVCKMATPGCTIYSMWVLFILSCYKRVQYTPRLKMKTANAGMTFLRCTTLSNTQRMLVAKFQINECSDNIIVDNIVGYAINNLPLDPKIRRHFMTYVDSCLAPLQTTTSGSTGAKAVTFDIHNIALEQMIKSPRGGRCVKLNLAQSVTDPTPLVDLFRATKNAVQATAVIRKVGDVMGAMFHLGSMYGFVHNDMHFGNILHDGIQDVLVVIDYGRAFFDTARMPINFKSAVEERLKFEELKSGVGYKARSCTLSVPWTTDYDAFCEKVNVYMTHELMTYAYNTKHHLAARTLFMFDQMTIAMNVVRMLDRGLMLPFEFSKCFGYDNHGRMRTVESCESIASMIIQARSTCSKRLMAGIFWYALFVEYLYKSLGLNHHANGVLKYEPKAISGFIFKSMQLTDVPDFAAFCAHVDSKKDAVNTVMNELRGLEARGGGSGTISQSKSPHDVQVPMVEHMPRKAFAQYFHAYNNTEKMMNVRHRPPKKRRA